MKSYKQTIFYTIIAVIIGIIVGAIDALFGRVLLAITAFRGDHVYVLIPFLALAGLLIVWMYQKFSPKAQGGMGLVFDTAFWESKSIPKALIPLIMLSTWITHLFGGSAGREGVAVQIGATLSHAVGRGLMKKSMDEKASKMFVVIGMAAGFAGLFQTPLAAAFFALEVLAAGELFLPALIPALTAAFTASYTSHLLGLEKFYVSFADSIILQPATVWKLILIAVIFGIVGGAFAKVLAIAKEKFGKLFKNPYLRILIMGACLSAVLLLLHSGRYAGLGTNLIAASFAGETIYGYDFALKFALTILTLAAGYQGGEVTPLFSIGATLGVLLASFFGLPVLLIAALGYAAVFGSATNTLLAPVFIGIEVFGPQHAVEFAIVCAIAFACNGNKTIYGKQRRIFE